MDRVQELEAALAEALDRLTKLDASYQDLYVNFEHLQTHPETKAVLVTELVREMYSAYDNGNKEVVDALRGPILDAIGEFDQTFRPLS